MLRRLVTELLESHLAPVVNPTDKGFQSLLGPAVKTFSNYASQSSAAPGAVEWAIAILIGLVLFLVASIAGMYVLLEFFSMTVNPVIRRFFGGKVTQDRRLIFAVLLHFFLLLVDSAIRGKVYAIEMTKRLAEDLAVVNAMFRGEVPNVGVDITGFTWGLLNDPLLEFVLQAGFLIGLTSVAVWKFTDYSERLVTGSLLVGSVGAWIYAEIQGIQVFPLPVQIGFVLQVLVLWAVMSVIAGILMYAVWGFLEWFPWVRYDHTRPKKLYITFHGLALLAMFPLFVENVMALLAWISAMLALYGGAEKGLRILLGYDQECRPDPETGIESCEWTRGD
jgi:hypothetical protein